MQKRVKRVITHPGTATNAVAMVIRGLGAELVVVNRVAQVRAEKWDCALILGGRDINPLFYGEAPTTSQPPDTTRDAVEWAILRTALAQGRPTMGICRGHQFLAVAAGGALYQDIGAITKRHGAEHMIRASETLLKHIPETWVNSYHHQAVRVVPFGWEVAAESPDGIIEGIYRPGFLGVQWHPEMLLGQWVSLFEWLLAGLT